MARSSSIGGIFAELTLRDKKFATGMKGAGARLKAFGTAAVKYGAMAGAALGAGLAVGVKRTIDMGGALTDLSAQTGVAIGDLMRIQQAYKDNGKTADSAGKDINKMQKAIALASDDPGGSADPFAKIGLSAKELLEMNPTQQFYAIGAAIKRIQNPAEKTAAAMAVFGKSGGELLAVFQGSDLDSVNQSLGKMPEIMQEFAAELDYAGDLLGRLPNKSDQFFAGFSVGIIEHIIPGLETIDNYDFTNIGKSLGDSLGEAIKHAGFLTNVLFDTAKENIGNPLGIFDFGEDMSKNIAIYSKAFNKLDEEYENAKKERSKDHEAEQLKKKTEAANAETYENIRQMEHGAAPKFIPDEVMKMFAEADDAETTKKIDEVFGIKKTAITPAIEEAMESGMSHESDSYQSRGLSLSANPIADNGKKMLDVQIEIRRILERFSMKESGLNWA